MNKKQLQIIWVLIFVLLSAGAAVGLRAWLHPPFHLQAAKLLPEPKHLLGQGYRLTFGGGDEPLDLDRLVGHWILFYFSYPGCGDMCAQQLRALTNMLNQFATTDGQYKPTVVYINLDAAPGKKRTLTVSTSSVHPGIPILSGNNDETDRLTRFFGVEPDALAERHSSQIFILDPHLRYIGAFPTPNNADVLYSDMQQLIHQLWRYHLKEQHSHAVIPAS